MYAIEPIGVVFPRDADDVAKAVEIAGRHDAPILPRGGGTSLGGQTVGTAVVLDFSRHMTDIVDVDPEAHLARVQPGLVQDDLNRAVEPHGLLFAPDTSTANRATLGGMIGNNSCGSRSARYGMTIDHVEALDVVLSDGSRARLEAVSPEEVSGRAKADTLEGRLYREIPPLLEKRADVIRAAMPSHWRRSGGYRLERVLPEAGPLNLAKLVVGSEGTLAVSVEATVRLVPKPRAVAALVGHFDSVRSAIEAVGAAMACDAAAVELVDRLILDLARVSPVHGHRVSLLEGEPGAILWVEFYGDSPEEAAQGMERLHELWKREGRAYAITLARTLAEQRGFRELRKAGLGLLMGGGVGRERSLAFVEDTAVDPSRLVEYTHRFSCILEEHGLRAGFYGHASAACLHIRPFMDLGRPGEVAKMRSVAEAVLELVREFGGMNSSEHGDGLARGEFNRRFFGEEFYGVMREVKGIFDPDYRLNPGKKVDPPLMTDHLREPALPKAPPLPTHFSFGEEGGFREAANRCMRIGACRKSPSAGGTMCPSYMATRTEEHSTRGRANALVKALSAPDPEAALGDERLHEILDLCLECKACQTECPLSVDMAAMKSEVQDRMVVLCNPLRPSGKAYDVSQTKHWHIIKIPAHQHPNVVEGREVIRGAVTREFVEQILREYGPDSPQYRSRVMAEWPLEDSEQLIKREWIDRAVEQWEEERQRGFQGTVTLALDVARQGPDRLCWGIARGRAVEALATWRGDDTVAACDRVQAEARKRAGDTARPKTVCDCTGLGWGHHDLLRSRH